MGVDATLSIPLHRCSFPQLMTAVARAHGLAMPMVDGEINTFAWRDLLEATSNGDYYDPEFARVEVKDTKEFVCWYHLDHDSDVGPVWELSGRSTAEFLAELRAVAHVFGGVLEYADSSGVAELYSPCDELSSSNVMFLKRGILAANIQKAEPDERDQMRAVYK